MGTRSSRSHLVTVIQVFTCRPENQQLLVELLVEAIERTLQHLPGFVEAMLDRSTDGERVTSQVRWRDRDSYDDMLRNPRAASHALATMDLSTFDAHFYERVGYYAAVQREVMPSPPAERPTAEHPPPAE